MPGARMLSTVTEPGRPAAKSSMSLGISRGIPAPMRTASTPANIAPYIAGGVAICNFVRKLIPTAPPLCFASHTSQKFAATDRISCLRSESSVVFGIGRYGRPLRPPSRKYVSRISAATSGYGKAAKARRMWPPSSPFCNRRAITASSAVPDTTPSWPALATACASCQSDTATPMPP